MFVSLKEENLFFNQVTSPSQLFGLLKLELKEANLLGQESSTSPGVLGLSRSPHSLKHLKTLKSDQGQGSSVCAKEVWALKTPVVLLGASGCTWVLHGCFAALLDTSEGAVRGCRHRVFWFEWSRFLWRILHPETRLSIATSMFWIPIFPGSKLCFFNRVTKRDQIQSSAGLAMHLSGAFLIRRKDHPTKFLVPLCRHRWITFTETSPCTRTMNMVAFRTFGYLSTSLGNLVVSDDGLALNRVSSQNSSIFQWMQKLSKVWNPQWLYGYMPRCLDVWFHGCNLDMKKTKSWPVKVIIKDRNIARQCLTNKERLRNSRKGSIGATNRPFHPVAEGHQTLGRPKKFARMTKKTRKYCFFKRSLAILRQNGKAS